MESIVAAAAEEKKVLEVSVDLEVSADFRETVAQERRSSSRLSGKKRLYYGSPKKEAVQEEEEVRRKNSKGLRKGKKNVGKVLRTLEGNDEAEDDQTANGEVVQSQEGGEVGVKEVEGEVVQSEGGGGGGGVASVTRPANWENYSPIQKVLWTIRTFNLHYLRFTQVEELRCKKVNGNSPKNKKSKGKSHANVVKRAAKRPDLKAITKMMQSGTVLFDEKKIGDLPGIEVGYRFYSRAEMVVIGCHKHWLNGIDYMGEDYVDKVTWNDKELKFPLTVSIVISGMYEDDLDNCDEVVYTGQGGNNLLGDKRQISDQVLSRGNLGLKHNHDFEVPVRVFRGHQCKSSYCGKVYTYDGLYNVIDHWTEKGNSGFTVFKFKLKRLEGQPPLTTNQVQFIRAQAPKALSELRGLVCGDISGGQESLPIPATNLVDDPSVAPSGYTYCRSNQIADGLSLPNNAPGCKCKGNCMDPDVCACAKLNGSDFPYVQKDGGRLVEAKAVVFECGPNCGCGPECVNRTSQRGLRHRLEVFRTPSKGWGVRSWDFIPAGAPICEYIGKLMRTFDLDHISENDFIFEIDCLQTMRGLDGRESRAGAVVPTSEHMNQVDDKILGSAPEFCIDAGTVGSVARFINHSCQPNLFVQCVLSSHHDMKLARVVLFAADNIPPLQELTYDYGYALDSVMGPDGKIKQLLCRCGAADCKKRLY